MVGYGSCDMSLPPETLQARQSKTLIENAKWERQQLLRVIADSQKLIERSREIIARLDQRIARAEKP